MAVQHEGKTKVVAPLALAARSHHKDDITAGDGAKHDFIPGKGALANRTTSNVFRLLDAYDIPVAFLAQDSDTSFIGYWCTMLPIEVVVRRIALGSYVKRNPSVRKGHRFEAPIVEMYLKTKDRTWEGFTLPCDDPYLAVVEADWVGLWRPDKPLAAASFLQVSMSSVIGNHPVSLLDAMARHLVQAFLVLEEAWRSAADADLADMKVEFGFDSDGTLRIADDIDNDSWRLLLNGKDLSKQGYREGEGLETVLRNYERVANFTEQFASERVHERIDASLSAPTYDPRYRREF